MKILLYDLETSPTLAYVWQLWEADALKVVEPWKILCFSYKWLGEKKTYTYSLPMFFGDEKELVKTLWSLFNEADILIAHNGDKFDQKKSYAKFIEHNLTPPEPYNTVDTLKVARRYFKFDSNRLDSLGEYLGLGRKIKTGGFDLWDRCMQGDEKAWKLMEKYNRGDVTLLEKIYLKLRPFMQNHPNLNVFNDTPLNCPICSSEHIQSRGYAVTKTRKYRRIQCQDCGGWSQFNFKQTIIK